MSRHARRIARITIGTGGIACFFGRRAFAKREIKSACGMADAKSMAIVPKKLGDKLSFFQSRLQALAEHSTQLGLTQEEVAALAVMVEEARAAANAQLQAQSAARSATIRYNAAVDAVGSTGAKIIATIRARAASSSDPYVLGLASIPPIATRSPMAAPGTPSNLRTDFMSANGLGLSWDCKNPKGSMGTVYYLSRRIGTTGPFLFLGISGERKFADDTIPAGATMLEYEIRAVRSTKAGVAANFQVSFGSNGSTMPAPFTPSRTGKTMLAA